MAFFCAILSKNHNLSDLQEQNAIGGQLDLLNGKKGPTVVWFQVQVGEIGFEPEHHDAQCLCLSMKRNLLHCSSRSKPEQMNTCALTRGQTAIGHVITMCYRSRLRHFKRDNIMACNRRLYCSFDNINNLKIHVL